MARLKTLSLMLAILARLFITPIAAYGEYDYVITFGDANWICHVKISIITSTLGNSVHVDDTTAWCADAGAALGAEIHHNIPAQDIEAYLTDLGPATQMGDHHFEVGINMRSFWLIPEMRPRVDMITNFDLVPQGFCNQRQGTVEVAQDAGEIAPRAECPAGSLSSSRFGIWTACFASCARF
ncbi:hypothetical protein Ptr902_12421 [Pyrenophora tritici-repentis]|nr:hypothetical protein L13192_08119 [Pyrenophora tritici-repentis]KAI2476145.1 hypothetical protein Ptr902_12421 [Pyrenophora tritici-repentis]